jgi:hypothetical protein
MRVVNLLLEYFALIRLKYTEPDTPRPFVVPGGKLGAYLIVLPTIVLSGTSSIPHNCYNSCYLYFLTYLKEVYILRYFYRSYLLLYINYLLNVRTLHV